jgi:hypothetical protein
MDNQTPIIITLSIFPTLDYRLQISQQYEVLTSKSGQIPTLSFEEYQQWQKSYKALQINSRLEAEAAQITQYGETEVQVCHINGQKLKSSLQKWFEHPSWQEIYLTIIDITQPTSEILVVFETKDQGLKKIPWSTWDLFQKRPKAAWSISSLDYGRNELQTEKANKVRILAILGNSENIDLEADRQFLNSIPDAEIKFLVEPNRSEIDDHLWEEHWHIIFFAGHSSSKEKGILKINPQESITIADLKQGLTHAIRKGLQLAIFNSCDGLQLAEDLAELNIPLVIVMREPVRDDVAHEFLMNFLNSYAIEHKTLYQAVREAQERLVGKYEPSDLENNWLEKIPGASWLPVLYHSNPNWRAPDWEVIRNGDEQQDCQQEYYWVNLATKKLKQEQELSNNFLTLANKEQQKNLAEIYVSLELNDTQLDSLSQDYSSSQPSLYQPEEFFDHILAEENTWKNYRGIAIIGEAGAGKTSYVQKLATLVIERNQGIPIFINLKKMVDEENRLISVEKYLYSIWLPQALKKPLTIPLSNSEKENFRKQLTTGRVWLFLDGLAEINAFSPLTALNEQLQDLLNSAQVKLIITCRQNLWLKRNNELNDFQCYYANPYTPDQREDFINKFFTNSNEEGQQLIEQLNLPENDRLKSLVSKPLYLNLLCLSWHYNAINFASLTQAQLYRYFIDSFKKWKSDIFYDSDKSVLELEQKLGKLSQSALDDDHFVFRLPESWLANYLGDPAHDKSYFGMAKKLGWLNQVEDNFGERYYSFIHSSFQEYLAAVNIDDWGFFLPKNHLDNPIKGKTYRIFNKRWHPIFYLWLGREIIKPEKKLEFIQFLLNFKDGCLEYNLYGYRAVLLVGGAIRELKNIDPVKVEEISNQIEDYLKKCLDEKLIFLAKRVIETIDREKIRTPPIINFFKAAITSKTAWLRRLTINTLGNLYLKDLNFLTPLLKDEDTSVAQMAALVLNNKSNLLKLNYITELNTFGKEIKSNNLNKLSDSSPNKIVEFSEKTILEVINIMLEDDNYLTKKSAKNFLEQELNSCSQKRYEFLNIVKNQADKFLKEEKIADLIDICLQKMTYPEFYEGWNSL